MFDDLAGLILQLNDTLTWFLFQLKSGLTSAPRLPHCSANKARLDIAQPDIIRPLVDTDRD